MIKSCSGKLSFFLLNFASILLVFALSSFIFGRVALGFDWRSLVGLNDSIFGDKIEPNVQKEFEKLNLSNKGVVRKRIVKLDVAKFYKFKSNKISLNLFPDRSINIIKDNLTQKTGDKFYFRGKVEKYPDSRVSLLADGNFLVGNIYMEREAYEVRIFSPGYSYVRQIDPGLLPPDFHDKLPVSKIKLPVTIMERIEIEKPKIATVEVYLPVSKEAAKLLGGQRGVEMTIEWLIDESNDIYKDNNVNLRLRVAKAEILDYKDAGDVSVDLSRITNRTDGLLDDLEVKRNSVQADIVSLFVGDGGDWCGYGAQFNPARKTTFHRVAYNVVDINCFTNYSFLHELGHNMGLQHDPDNAGGGAMYDYAYGYRIAGKFRTIMAYPCEKQGLTRCNRMAYFSSPLRSYNGNVVGNAATNDNAQALNSTRFMVASFRPQLSSLPKR